MSKFAVVFVVTNENMTTVWATSGHLILSMLAGLSKLEGQNHDDPYNFNRAEEVRTDARRRMPTYCRILP